MLTKLSPASGARCGAGAPGWPAAAIDGNRHCPATRRGLEVTLQVAMTADEICGSVGHIVWAPAIACTTSAFACFRFCRCRHLASALST